METSDQYDPIKVDKLLHYLEFYAQAGDPVAYEILVDGIIAVKLTTDISHFQSFRSYVTSDTDTVVIVLYKDMLKSNEKRLLYFPKLSEICFVEDQVKQLLALLSENRALLKEITGLEFEIARWKKRFGIDPLIDPSTLHQN